MSNKKAINDIYNNSSQEFKDSWYEIMFGKDGKSGIIKEPYPVNLIDLIPEGVKLLKKPIDKLDEE